MKTSRTWKRLCICLLELEQSGILLLEILVNDLEETQKTDEQIEIYKCMLNDLFFSSDQDNEVNGNVITTAINTLLPYVSGHTLTRNGLGYDWILTNKNKNIAATARQREWQRQTLICLERIEDLLTERGER
jgi:uncharacterized protein YpmS